MLELSPWLCLRVLCVVLIDEKSCGEAEWEERGKYLGPKGVQGLVLSFLVILNFLLPQSNLVYPLQR